MMREILALVALALALLFAEFRCARRACEGREQSRRQGLDLQAGPHLERHDIDLGTIAGDRIPDGVGHLLRRDFADHGAGLEPRLRPHAGFSDEGWADHGDADSRVYQLLA